MKSIKELIKKKNDNNKSHSSRSFSNKSLEKILPRNSNSFLISKPKKVNPDEKSMKFSNFINHQRSNSQKLIKFKKKDEEDTNKNFFKKNPIFLDKNHSHNNILEIHRNSLVKLNLAKNFALNRSFKNFQNSQQTQNNFKIEAITEYLNKSNFFLIFN